MPSKTSAQPPIKRVGTQGIKPCRREGKAERQRPENILVLGRRHARHLRGDDNDEDGKHGLDLDPVGVAAEYGIARLDLQQWQKRALQAVGDEKNAAEEGQLEKQQVSIVRADRA